MNGVRLNGCFFFLLPLMDVEKVPDPWLAQSLGCLKKG